MKLASLNLSHMQTDTSAQITYPDLPDPDPGSRLPATAMGTAPSAPLPSCPLAHPSHTTALEMSNEGSHGAVPAM
eukprot:4465159-Pleurochrysis_carterae.AAC.1